MRTDAIVLEEPRALGVRQVELTEPGESDVVVDMLWSGISTGTEKLLWSGEMPWFPGFGYPLVPGYEGVGIVADAGPASPLSRGQRVFVPGATCFADARGLFGASAARLVVPSQRVTPVDEALGERAVLLSLAATAQHAISSSPQAGPTLIVGHGVLGRLLARLLIARGDEPPTVWESQRERQSGSDDYIVCQSTDDACSDYATVFDASGDVTVIDLVTPRIRHHGEIVLGGFYAVPVAFNYPQAFMREARIRIAAEWQPEDLAEVMRLLDTGTLSLNGLISHRADVRDAASAYEVAFEDPRCTKMILAWRH
ncbi:MAG: chlorophyll synthesis pathway protein BchC [Pseudomonadota bacterium]